MSDHGPPARRRPRDELVAPPRCGPSRRAAPRSPAPPGDQRPVRRRARPGRLAEPVRGAPVGDAAAGQHAAVAAVRHSGPSAPPHTRGRLAAGVDRERDPVPAAVAEQHGAAPLRGGRRPPTARRLPAVARPGPGGLRPSCRRTPCGARCAARRSPVTSIRTRLDRVGRRDRDGEVDVVVPDPLDAGLPGSRVPAEHLHPPSAPASPARGRPGSGCAPHCGRPARRGAAATSPARDRDDGGDGPAAGGRCTSRPAGGRGQRAHLTSASATTNSIECGFAGPQSPCGHDARSKSRQVSPVTSSLNLLSTFSFASSSYVHDADPVVTVETRAGHEVVRVGEPLHLGVSW